MTEYREADGVNLVDGNFARRASLVVSAWTNCVFFNFAFIVINTLD